MIIRRGKVWGTTSTLFCKNNVKVARIMVKKGGYCSQHDHAHNNNMFYVESGKVKITIYRLDAEKEIEDITVLETGDATYVESGLYHCFEGLEESVVIEIYWVELDENDIRRRSVGGIK